jgi:hypothetical protein
MLPQRYFQLLPGDEAAVISVKVLQTQPATISKASKVGTLSSAALRLTRLQYAVVVAPSLTPGEA